MIEISIVIPCFNEERSIEQTIRDVKRWALESGIDIEVIVGDNNSQDNSHTLALDAGANVISVYPKGYGNVVIEASKHAKGEFLIFLDADGQHKVADITSIYASLKAGADLVIGNRFHSHKRTFSTSFIKEYVGNPLLTYLGKFLFKSKINDFHSGLRGVRTKLFNSLPLASQGFELCSELIAKAESLDARVEQVPISVTKPYMNRKSNIRPVIDGFKHVHCLLGNAMLYKKYSRVFLFLFSINLLMILPFLLNKGLIVTSDTATYDQWSDLFIKNGFSGILNNNTYFFSKIFYLFHLLYLCLLKIFFGSHWMGAHYVFNIIVHILTGTLIFFNGYRLTKNAGISLLSNILFYFSIEYVTITSCILSDTNFIFLINLLFFVFLYRELYRLKGFVSLLAILLITVFYRPTGVLVLFLITFFSAFHFLKWRVSPKKILGCLLVFFVVLLAANSYVLSRGSVYISELPLYFLRSKFGFDLNGIVVWDRYVTNQPFYHNELNALTFYAVKFMRFFQFVVPGFGYLHQLFNIIFFGITYSALIYILVKKRTSHINYYLIIFFIFLTAFFHTFTVIDYDWRYRLVLVPFLCNLFAVAATQILKQNDRPL